jgi:hypothetical protein
VLQGLKHSHHFTGIELLCVRLVLAQIQSVVLKGRLLLLIRIVLLSHWLPQQSVAVGQQRFGLRVFELFDSFGKLFCELTDLYLVAGRRLNCVIVKRIFNLL